MSDIITLFEKITQSHQNIDKQKLMKIKSDLADLLNSEEGASELSIHSIRQNQVENPQVQKVIKIVQTMLQEKLQGSSCTLKQKDIIAKWSGGRFNFARLDAMERAFIQAGRKVEYDKPSYGDSNFDAYFSFTWPK